MQETIGRARPENHYTSKCSRIRRGSHAAKTKAARGDIACATGRNLRRRRGGIIGRDERGPHELRVCYVKT